jgi:hypothetical protein
MKRTSLRNRAEKALARIRKMFRRTAEPPEDPYAYVGAPKKPRAPLRGSAVAEPLE